MSKPQHVTNVASGPEKCAVCGKRVYATEKILVENNILHETCFRCAMCKTKLNPNFMGSLDGKWYCQAHFQQISEDRINKANEDKKDESHIGGGMGAIMGGHQ